MSTARRYDSGTLPDGWRMVRLGDIAEVMTGNTPSRNVAAYYGGEVSWIKPSDLASRRLVFSSEEYLTDAGLGVARQVPAKSVLVSCIGTIGQVGISAAPIAFNQQINALVPGGMVLPEYLYWACVQAAEFIRSIAAKTAVPIVNKTEFSAVRIPLPPLPEQRAIADVLDSIDEAIERTEAVIAATETLRDSLLHELLTRGVPGWHTEWKDLPGIGTIPADWEVVRLGDMAYVKGGKRLPKGSTFADHDTGLPYIRVVDFRDGTVDANSMKYLPPEVRDAIARYTINSADVYISIAGTIGLVGIVPDHLNGANLTENAAKIVIANPNQIVHQYLSSYLGSHAGKKQIRKRINALGQPNLALERIRTIEVPVPAIGEQTSISATLDCVDSTIEKAKEERDALRSHKESTANVLLAGLERAPVLEDRVVQPE